MDRAAEMTKLAAQPNPASIAELCKTYRTGEFDMTKSISTTEFMREFGRYHDEARQTPITLTKYGRPSVVVLSADLFGRMCGNADPRRAYATGEMPEELADMFAAQLEADSTDFKATMDD